MSKENKTSQFQLPPDVQSEVNKQNDAVESIYPGKNTEDLTPEERQIVENLGGVALFPTAEIVESTELQQQAEQRRQAKVNRPPKKKRRRAPAPRSRDTADSDARVPREYGEQ